MISASVGVNSSLLLEPAQTLTFALDAATVAARGARACLTLTNISPRKHVVFKVRTTNVDMFMVKPAQGVIEPSGDVPIVITLLPEASERLLRMAPHERAALIERFLIQSIDRSEDMLGFGVDDLTAFWRRLPKELITNKKLTCKFIEVRDGEPDVRLPLQRMRLQPAEPVAQAPPAFVPPHQPQNMPPRSPVKNEAPQTSPPQTNSREPVPQVRLSNKHDQKKPKPPQSISAQARSGQKQPARTPPTAMNMPSSPVPSLRPKPVFVHHSSSTSSHSSNHSSQDGQDNQDLATGSSNDSYATNRVAQMQYDERIQSDDTLEFRLHPSESLLFPVHHAYPDDSPTGIVEGKSYFFITNKARHSGLAFKIKTSNHMGYFVKPARGFIDPKSAQRVDVFVNAPDATRFNSQDREMKDRFLVELLFVGPAKASEMLSLKDDEKRQELLHLWDKSKAADRRQSVLACQILEEDSPIDPSHQTAEQARQLLQKSQVANTLSFNNNSPVPRDSTGESANPWIHAPPPTSPAMHMPRSNQHQQHQNQHVRSPVMQSRSPVKQQPRSPEIASAQMRSPVRQQQQYQPQPQQPQYYGGEGVPQRHQRAAFDDDGTFYP